MVYVFNKADKTSYEFPTMEGDDHVVISAKNKESLDLLTKVIKQHLFNNYRDAQLLVPFTDGHVVSYLNEHANITNTEYQNDGTLLKVEISPSDLQRFEKYVVE